MMRIKILALLFLIAGLWITPVFATDVMSDTQLKELERGVKSLNNAQWLLEHYRYHREGALREDVKSLREGLQELRLSYGNLERRVVEALKTFCFKELIYLNPTLDELREAITSFHYITTQLHQDKSTEHESTIACLNQHAYYASKQLFLKEDATVDDINLHWLCCNEVKKYDEAYDAVTLILDKHKQPLENLQDNQLTLLVNTFSHCTILAPQKQDALVSFLMTQGSPTSYVRLLKLYVNRRMDLEIATFCKSYHEDLLKITDGSLSGYLEDMAFSLLIAKEYDLSQKFSKGISDLLTVHALKAFTDVARGDQQEAQISINIFASALEQDYQTPAEEKELPFFFLHLCRKNMDEAIKSLKHVRTDKMQSSALIYLKGRAAAPQKEVEDLKKQYFRDFSSHYIPSDFRFSNALIDIAVKAGEDTSKRK